MTATGNKGVPATPAATNGAANGAVNGAKTGDTTRGRGDSPLPKVNGEGHEPAGERTGGIGLFDGGPGKLRENLEAMLLGNDKTQGTKAQGENPNPEGEGTETESRADGETESGSEAEGTEGTDEGTEEAEEEATAPGDWPATAIAEVAKLRAARRELKGELEPLAQTITEQTAEIERLQGELDAAAEGRPVAATAEVPLAFLKTEAELGNYARQMRANVRAFEDYLDGAATPQAAAAIEKWAADNGAVDAETGKPQVAVLKRWKRDAEDALQQHVPIRAQQLKQAADMNAHAEQTFDFLKKKASQEYKDFAQVLRDVPGLASLPSAKVGAAIFALGMKEYRKMIAKNGTEGTEGTDMTNGKPTPKPKDKAKPAINKLPGRTVRLPRTTGSREGHLAALREKAFKTGKTKADVEAYTRALLGPHVAA